MGIPPDLFPCCPGQKARHGAQAKSPAMAYTAFAGSAFSAGSRIHRC